MAASPDRVRVVFKTERNICEISLEHSLDLYKLEQRKNNGLF